ncbi:MAG: restriction endonuclease subunit S [Clostridia bacterium]|nr:restriction endonuclease subunit S [Clostridia bacterium]
MANTKANTVTISEGGNSCGYVNFMKEPFWCGAHCYYFYSTKGNSKYLYYALKSQQNKIMKLRSGACMPNIKKNDLANFEFEYDFNEINQNLVVNKLDKIQEIIDIRMEQIRQLEELVKARFVELFGDTILNPYGWNVVTVGDIVTDVRYGTSKPAVEGGKYPYLRMNNLTYDGHLDLSDMKYIDISDNEIEKCIVRKGDVLFNRTNSIELVGKTCVFDLDDDMVIAGYIIRVRLNEKLLPIVLSSYLNLPSLKEQLRSMAKGAVNQANINAQELQSIKIYLPPIELQNQFATFVEQTDKSKLEYKKSLVEMQNLMESLMNQYFS